MAMATRQVDSSDGQHNGMISGRRYPPRLIPRRCKAGSASAPTAIGQVCLPTPAQCCAVPAEASRLASPMPTTPPACSRFLDSTLRIG
jgi:hypothetical protein